jgi:hypothetical protein
MRRLNRANNFAFDACAGLADFLDEDRPNIIKCRK